MLRLHRTDRSNQFTHAVVTGVAHVDAEDVRPGLEQAINHSTVARRRPERRDDFSPPLSPHFLVPAVAPGVGAALAGGTALSGLPTGLAFCRSPDSVNWTVQDFCSAVSTSKKPVRSKPCARQSLVPRIVNSLSRVHMKA